MQSIGITICALVLCVLQARGNPISKASIEKTWERCLVAIDHETADVSCAVGYEYKVTDRIGEALLFSVPVFLPEGSFSGDEQALHIVNPRLEMAGKIHQPVRVHINSTSSEFKGTTRVDFAFLLLRPNSRPFTIVVTYRQPLLGKSFAYLPQFEPATKPREPSSFTLTTFPKGAGTVYLATKHKNVAESMSTRLTLTPTHDELIIVEHSKPGEQPGTGQPATRPVVVPEGGDKP